MNAVNAVAGLIRGYRVGEMFMPRRRKGEGGRGASVEREIGNGSGGRSYTIGGGGGVAAVIVISMMVDSDSDGGGGSLDERLESRDRDVGLDRQVSMEGKMMQVVRR